MRFIYEIKRFIQETISKISYEKEENFSIKKITKHGFSGILNTIIKGPLHSLW